VPTNVPANNSARPPLSLSRGKLPRIIQYLTEHFPEGVPPAGICPRNKLNDAILKADATLKTLDEATLKKAIDQFSDNLAKKT
jgi:hypothetical protein